MLTQEKIVITHFLNNSKSITPKEAYTNYGIARLASIVFKLRQRGWVIRTERVPNKGKPGWYAKYWLESNSRNPESNE